MKVILHPVYFPNIVTMAVLAQFECQWEVWDNYQKQTYRNRCYIGTDQGKLLLNIPIKHVGGSTGRQAYNEVRIDDTYPWQRQHWKSLQTAYRSAPFFEYYEEDLLPLFEQPFERLIDLNLATAQCLGELLGIRLPESTTQSYEPTYPKEVEARGLVQAKQEPAVHCDPYPQVFEEKHGFLPNLSALDLLFNEGTNALGYLKRLDLRPLHLHD